MRTVTRLALALLALVLASAAQARKLDEQAAEARARQLPAVTVYIDADWGNRTNGAARALSAAHAAFGRAGYVLVDVEGYSENGDLQGFFVSYRREPAAAAEPSR
jgi:opacity protein-like surface antigen